MVNLSRIYSVGASKENVCGIYTRLFDATGAHFGTNLQTLDVSGGYKIYRTLAPVDVGMYTTK